MSDTAVAESGTRIQNFLDRAGLRGFPWKTATILYTISWGWLIIVRHSLWADDWARFPKYSNFPWDSVGLAPWLKFERTLFDLLGLSGSRALIFGSFFASALFLFSISGSLTVLSLVQRRVMVLLFLVAPFNTARVSLQTIHYSNSYFLFFFAWYLLITFKSKKLSVLSLVLFFLSFGMHSLLSFYFLPVLHRVFLSKSKNLRFLLSFARANFLMLVLPFLYWIARAVFWPEKVPYHYVSLARLSGATSFFVFSGLLVLLVVVLQRRTFANKQSLQIILVGIFCLFLGIFAYVVSGFFRTDWSFFSIYLATFLGRSDWYSRHQTLQPLGASLLIVGAIGLLPNSLKKLTRRITALALAVCVLFNIGFGFEYVVDHAKQKEVIGVLKEDGESKLGSNYQFIDQTTLLNARGRVYRERDWKGLIWLAYGVESLQLSRVETICKSNSDTRLVLIQGPRTHWEALKHWVNDGDMGFKVTVDDTPGACKPEMVTSEKVSGAIPILFYFTGAKG
jgi:hypothetical protein